MFKPAVRFVPVVRPSVPSRSFRWSPVAAKSATDKAKEVADKVNKSVGQGLASAIEKGEEATETTKKALGSVKDQAKQGADKASQKAKQATTNRHDKPT